MEIIKQKQREKQQQLEKRKTTTMKTKPKPNLKETVTKPQLVNPNTENRSLEKNDIRLYLTEKIGRIEVKTAAFQPTTQLVLPPFPPPTTHPPRIVV